MGEAIRIGILGTSGIASRAVIEPARKLSEASVVGIAARDRSRASAYAQLHGIENVFPDYASLLHSDAIDLVYIPLPNALHAAWIIEAARAGKHILVEKPLCCSFREFEAIRDAVTSNRVHLLEGLMVEHHPWQAKVAEIIADKSFGALRSIQTQITFKANLENNYRAFPENGGGVFLDVGIYWLQFIQACRPLDPQSLEAKSDFNGPNGIDMRFDASMVFADGLTASLFCSFEGPFEVTHWLQFGNARLRTRNFFRAAVGMNRIHIDFRQDTPSVTDRISFPPQNYYQNQLAFFLGVVNGREENIPLDRSGERIRLLESLYNLAKDGAQNSQQHDHGEKG